MRFKHPEIGDQKTCTFFAFLPVTTRVYSTRIETRWLERVTVRYVYRGDSEGWVPYSFGGVN